jgi:ATP phosphoribosyltransferase regulatory subunit HisZ
MGNVRLILSLVKLLLGVVKLVRAELIKVKEEKLKKELEDAINKKDQRKLEKEIGSSNAGKPSQHQDGVEIHPRKQR